MSSSTPPTANSVKARQRSERCLIVENPHADDQTNEDKDANQLDPPDGSFLVSASVRHLVILLRRTNLRIAPRS